MCRFDRVGIFIYFVLNIVFASTDDSQLSSISIGSVLFSQHKPGQCREPQVRRRHSGSIVMPTLPWCTSQYSPVSTRPSLKLPDGGRAGRLAIISSSSWQHNQRARGRVDNTRLFLSVLSSPRFHSLDIG